MKEKCKEKHGKDHITLALPQKRRQFPASERMENLTEKDVGQPRRNHESKWMGVNTRAQSPVGKERKGSRQTAARTRYPQKSPNRTRLEAGDHRYAWIKIRAQKTNRDAQEDAPAFKHRSLSIHHLFTPRPSSPQSRLSPGSANAHPGRPSPCTQSTL